jgi:hypothetical protein
MAATNKRLLISESHGDSNRCTPYRENPDQHDTYAFHVSPRMPGVCFMRTVPVCGNLSRVIDRVEQGHCSREKGRLIQSISHRLTDPWVRTQFLSGANLEAVGAKPIICTFNTYSWVPTPQSLTDTGGDYHTEILE